MKSYLCAY